MRRDNKNSLLLPLVHTIEDCRLDISTAELSQTDTVLSVNARI